MVSKAFYYCYKIANENNKLILNIILNKNLAENILSIIEDDLLSEINEIKNNCLANVDTNLYTCKKNINKINIMQFKYLYEDEEEIKKEIILNLFFDFRKEMGVEYNDNDSMHNQTIDIYNIFKEEIEN